MGTQGPAHWDVALQSRAAGACGWTLGACLPASNGGCASTGGALLQMRHTHAIPHHIPLLHSTPAAFTTSWHLGMAPIPSSLPPSTPPHPTPGLWHNVQQRRELRRALHSMRTWVCPSPPPPTSGTMCSLGSSGVSCVGSPSTALVTSMRPSACSAASAWFSATRCGPARAHRRAERVRAEWVQGEQCYVVPLRMQRHQVQRSVFRRTRARRMNAE